jgi:hypothetical protein
MREDRYNKNLVDYFKKNLGKGYTSEALKWALIKQGYLKIAVEKALIQANKELAEKAPVLKEKPIIKHEIVDEENRLIKIKKPLWKRVFG